MAGTDAPPSLAVDVWGLGDRRVPYLEAWERQRELHAAVAAGAMPGTVVLLEHESVYTAGRSTQPGDRPFDGSPVIDVDRGGRITWHGPGQLVAYPIVRLGAPLDVRAYVCRLEDAIIATCADFGVAGGRLAGRPGVWVAGERKVAAIGVRVAKGTTLHGLALNCNNDPSWFDRIVPCGIRDAGVTSLTAERGEPVEVAEASSVLLSHLVDRLSVYR